MADALIEYHENRTELSRDRAKDAATALGTATEAVDALRGDHSGLVDKAAALDADIAAKRNAASGPDLTATEIETLAADLRWKLIARRKLTAALLAKGDELKRAELKRDALRDLASAASGALAADERAKADAETRGERVGKWMEDDVAEAVAALVAEADTLLAERDGTAGPAADPESEEGVNRKLIADARDRIEDEIPAALHAHARARVRKLVTERDSALTTHLQELENARADILLAANGRSGATELAWLAYDRVEEALGAIVLGTGSLRNRALALLASVVASPPSIIDTVLMDGVGDGAPAADDAADDQADDTAPIDDADDGAGGDEDDDGGDGGVYDRDGPLPADDAPADDGAATDPFATELALVEVKARIAEAELELDALNLATRLADPLEDPSTNAEVIAAEEALQALKDADLTEAEEVHDDKKARTLDLAEVAVPDRAWINLANYDAAVKLLERISGTSLALADAKAALEAARGDLVAKLGEEDVARRGKPIATAALDAARGLEEHRAGLAETRRLSALRGDA